MKVLLVGEEIEFVTTLSNQLSLRGMGVDVVFDGQAALDYIEKCEPDVVVLDLDMPGLDGTEVLRELSKSHLDN
jgi:DNA-binding response OmpR family regulator